MIFLEILFQHILYVIAGDQNGFAFFKSTKYSQEFCLNFNKLNMYTLISKPLELLRNIHA